MVSQGSSWAIMIGTYKLENVKNKDIVNLEFERLMVYL
jgi:hypothetical protein